MATPKSKKPSKNHFVVVAVVCIVLVVILYFFQIQKKVGEEIYINGHNINVEIANTPQKRQLGLGNRDGLCNKCGMLFIFDDKEKRIFWMKDMRFDIDIVWIRDDVIVGVAKNVSHYTPTKQIYSPQKVNKVLELPAGNADKFDIGIGDEIVIK